MFRGSLEGLQSDSFLVTFLHSDQLSVTFLVVDGVIIFEWYQIKNENSELKYQKLSTFFHIFMRRQSYHDSRLPGHWISERSTSKKISFTAVRSWLEVPRGFTKLKSEKQSTWTFFKRTDKQKFCVEGNEAVWRISVKTSADKITEVIRLWMENI